MAKRKPKKLPRPEYQKLRAYLNNLSTQEQVAFATRVGTTIGFLRKAICADQDISSAVAMNIEGDTDHSIRCEGLLPDLSWHVLRESA